ncbi:MAG TPA: helix-turn-helix transcriptional regulator [Polyangia bacterium]|jgi:transcriptional regulator with XRE-family HTH domain
MAAKTRKSFGSKSLERRFGKLTLGEMLNTWRVSEDLSLKDFGRRLGMSVANLCDIEKGRKGVSPEKAEQIARAIGVPPALLVRLSIEDTLRAAGLKYKVALKPAA